MRTRNEIRWALLAAAALLASGPTAVLGERPLKEPRPVQAVDASGREIGTVLTMDHAAVRMQVALEINDTLVPVLVRKDSFSHGSRPIAYFRLPDCAGGAHLGAGSQETLGPPVGIAGPRATLFWGHPETMQLRDIQSALFNGECRELSAALMVMDADPLMDLADEFVPPFGIAPGSRDHRGSRRPTAQD